MRVCVCVCVFVCARACVCVAFLIGLLIDIKLCPSFNCYHNTFPDPASYSFVPLFVSLCGCRFLFMAFQAPHYSYLTLT